MRKNDVIALLNKLEGNPEVVLWNGFVGDYQHFNKKLVKGYLVKQTLSHYIEMCRLEECQLRRDWDFRFTNDELDDLKRMYRKVCKWEVNEFVTQEDIDHKRYDVKRVIYIQPKVRNETYFDRMGVVSY